MTAWREIWRSYDADVVAEIRGYVVRIAQPDADGATDTDPHATYWTVDDVAEFAAAVQRERPQS